MLVMLIALSGCTKSKAILWNGIPVCGSHLLVNGMLFVDARGQIRQFNHRNTIDHFYLDVDDDVEIVATFNQHTDLLDRINIIADHPLKGTLDRFASELGPPDSVSPISPKGPIDAVGPSMGQNGARAMTWRTRTGLITIRVNNGGSKKALQYDQHC